MANRTDSETGAATRSGFAFETSLGELEKTVRELESGDLPLEQALKAFEKGIRLTRDCQKALQDAEQKVRILLEQDGQTTLQNFDQPEEN
ncbi:exodeoxyribonuclease VII small subunit [Parendozoicomonas haliclonae]|uniref:Exodeoxyribonuclease 7 small subunit n=1 Tax=Parendozoicomonas haliclonae TaxID=1960125 RepID=A0A1X7AN26_9GAMM|nr:exodeoxyribonuclease VII small subunit [Parendozoicomonas haliclonae]SMA49492.1 Exodeoxyribonuclease 7 small subunit [Parendozoicomonas haliclonae]